MMTPTLMYQQMKKWVASDTSRPAFQHIYFDGERAFATDVHRLAVVKNFPAKEAYWATVQGAPAQFPEGKIPTPPNFFRAIPEQEKSEWVMTMEMPLNATKGILLHWKNTAEYIKKVARELKYSLAVLQKTGDKLYIYTLNRYIRAKVLLMDKLPDSGKNADWMAGFNSGYLLDAFEFLKATDPRTLTLYTGSRNILIMETEDIQLVITPVNMNPQKSIEDEWLLDFVKSETPPTPEPEDETPDFLQ